MNVLDLFDALHPGASWKPWRAGVAAVYGEPLDDEELELFRRHTGRQHPREGGYPEAVFAVAVQTGKTSVVATLMDHAALTGAPGTIALGVAQDYRSAMRALLRYARQPFQELPAFRSEVTRETADTLELQRGTTLAVYPCRPAGVRGVSASIACLDELAFYTSTEGRPTDQEMLRVARGRVANTGGKVIVLSSPYAQTGALWELHRRHYGREDSPTLVWQASAPEMNPTLSGDYLARMEAEDAEAYRSEVLGEFRQGIATFFDPDVLDEAVPPGVRERPFNGSTKYVAAFDASGGRRDAAALALAHREGDRGVLDLIRAWPAPHNPAAVIAEAADILRRYRVSSVLLDRFAGEYPAEQFRAAGINGKQSPRTTSETYLETLPLVNAGAAVLLDDPALLRELRGLERHALRSGKDRVDHRPGAGSHDDRAAAACAALVAAASRKARKGGTWGTRGRLRTPYLSGPWRPPAEGGEGERQIVGDVYTPSSGPGPGSRAPLYGPATSESRVRLDRLDWGRRMEEQQRAVEPAFTGAPAYVVERTEADAPEESPSAAEQLLDKSRKRTFKTGR